MKKRNLTAVLLILAFVLIAWFTAQRNTDPDRPTFKVLVATQEIPFGTVIDEPEKFFSTL